jgi:hypothetical protein
MWGWIKSTGSGAMDTLSSTYYSAQDYVYSKGRESMYEGLPTTIHGLSGGMIDSMSCDFPETNLEQ